MPLHVPPLQIARGIYSETPALVWGEPSDAYVPWGGGTVETVWIGGRDGRNHLVGGGLQDSDGEPTYPAPRGVTVFDYLGQNIWVSNGWQNDPYGLFQNIMPTPFLGWTAFCACITGNPPGYGYGSGYYGGTGGGGGGLVVTPCCPDGISTTTYLAVTHACDSRLDANYQLDWKSSLDAWKSAAFAVGATNFDWRLKCANVNAVWGFYLFLEDLDHQTGGVNDVAVWAAAASSCPPPLFSASGSGAPSSSNITSICGGSLSLTWSIDD